MDEPSHRVDKPWGHEKIWARTEHYVGKLLVIEPGKRLSLQRHREKDESILVLRGPLRLHLQDAAGELRIEELEAGAARRIVAGRLHRFEALDRVVELVEVSTPQLDDVERLEDDYGREGTREP